MLGMFVIVGIIQNSMNDRLGMLPQRNVDYHSENQARNISSSLMDYAISEIRWNQDWKGENDNGFSSNNFLGGEGTVRVYDMNDAGDPDVDVPPNSIPTWDQYTRLLYATATYNGTTVETEVMLTQDSFSRFSYFTDVEPVIYFFSGDSLTGPVHSNDQFNMAGTPTFNGRVTSTEMYRSIPGTYTEPVFLEGANFEAREIPLPTDEQLNELRSAGNIGGLKYENSIDVELFSNGDIEIDETTLVPSGGTTIVTHYKNMNDFNGVISSTQDISIKGQLNGELTVHSEKDIEITGDLTYSEDPRVNENSDDILGLVSEGNVMIEKNAHLDHGYSDIEIHASIMALDQSFYVEDYNQGSPRGEIELLGGIIQETRGAVGTFSGNSTSTGFNKNYAYDQRLLRINPPFYPRESFFEIFYWKDRVVVSS
jgi:cytoskeletal protein CcmA (bactofilin family)